MKQLIYNSSTRWRFKTKKKIENNSFLIRILECNCQSWCGAFVRRIPRSTRCCGILVLLASSSCKTRQNGTVAKMHLRSRKPKNKKNTMLTIEIVVHYVYFS